MPFDGSGNFVRKYGSTGWEDDATAGTKIRADLHDNHDEDMAANGLSLTITRNGQSIISTDIPWNGKKITNLGPPTNPNDAARLTDVQAMRDFQTGLVISGSGLNGLVTFSAPSGVQGLGWTSNAMSWVAKKAGASQTIDRLAVNNNGSGTGTDVATVDREGRINSAAGQLEQNLHWDGGNWRVITAGIGTLVTFATGIIAAYANDVATVADWLIPTPLRNFFSVNNNAGSPILSLFKTASTKTILLRTFTGTSLRWQLSLGDATAEASDSAGSDLYIHGFKQDGTTAVPVFYARRKDGYAQFYGDVRVMGTLQAPNLIGAVSMASTLTVAGLVTGGSLNSNNGVLGGSGANVFLRPAGSADGTNQAQYTSAGDLTIARYMKADGYYEKAGTTGSFGTELFNFNWASPNLAAWVNTTFVGNVSLTCDYRIKRDVHPLSSTWEKVKQLRPVTFRYADFVAEDGTQLSAATDDEQWGFLAHELQEALLPTAASGHQDAPGMLQGPNTMAVVAALAAALQEAQARIEALEARAA